MKKYTKSSTLSAEDNLVINALPNIVEELQYRYWKQYHTEPKYIKMPTWIVTILERCISEYVSYSLNDNTIRTYMGFIVCPTNSIVSIHEIEVF